MPFAASTNSGNVITPEEAASDGEYECPACSHTLTVRRSHYREGTFVARHFWHPNRGDGCQGGESNKHRRMKSIALSTLKDRFPVGEAYLEKKVGNRVADTLVKFDMPIDRFGRGVIAEVQYRNTGKDVDEVTWEYNRKGYSVYWLTEDDFNERNVRLEEPILAFPNGVPHDSEPPLKVGIDQSAKVEASFPSKWFEDEIRSAYEEGRSPNQVIVEALFPPVWFKDVLSKAWKKGVSEQSCMGDEEWCRGIYSDGMKCWRCWKWLRENEPRDYTIHVPSDEFT